MDKTDDESENLNNESAPINSEANQWETLKDEEFQGDTVETDSVSPPVSEENKEQRVASARESVVETFRKTENDKKAEQKEKPKYPVLFITRFQTLGGYGINTEDRDVKLISESAIEQAKKTEKMTYEEYKKIPLDEYNKLRNKKIIKRFNQSQAERKRTEKFFKRDLPTFGKNEEQILELTPEGGELFTEVFMTIPDDKDAARLWRSLYDSINGRIDRNQKHLDEEYGRLREFAEEEICHPQLTTRIEKAYIYYSEELSKQRTTIPSQRPEKKEENKKELSFAVFSKDEQKVALEFLPKLAAKGLIPKEDKEISKIWKNYDKVQSAHQTESEAEESIRVLEKMIHAIENNPEKDEFSESIKIAREIIVKSAKTAEKQAKVLSKYDLSHLVETVKTIVAQQK